jgi:uncharacterized LabA/DUF88 family protein
MNNYAFIDGANLLFTFENLRWHLSYHKLRVCLKEHYSVSRAYYFIGDFSEHKFLYLDLDREGYTMMLKPLTRLPNGKIKANCDTELVLQAMIDKPTYDNAVIVTSDGDFSCLVAHLASCNKLYRVIAPCLAGCSHLLTEAGRTKMDFMDNMKTKLEDK